MKISYIARIPLSTVMARIAKLERDREEAERRPIDGWPEGEGGYFAILQS
jgi:hypothetical protein